jgi:hypothetical protein
MATTIDVLILIDVNGALELNPPIANGNVYMVDTNKFFGSLQEGGEELITTVSNGQTIVWSVAPVDPATSVAIAGFTGAAVGSVIAPVSEPQEGTWSAQVDIPLNTPVNTQFQYSVELQLGGQTLSFDPYLQVAPPNA